MNMRTNSTLGYKGRIISLLFVGTLILFVRTVVIHQYGEMPHKFPIPAIIAFIVAWQIGKSYDKTLYLSMKDTLTNLYNRRFVLNKFDSLAKYATNKGLKIAILVSDVNDFKNINDHYGHEYGDKVLLNIAKSLLNSFNRRDIIARWGGDEFLILSVYKNEEAINTKISNFQSTISQLSSNAQMKSITLSIGKATYPTDHTNLEELIAIADANMYEIKLNYKEKNN